MIIETLNDVSLDIIIGVIVVLSAITFCLQFFIKTIWPKLKMFSQMLDDWTGTAERPGVAKRSGVMERLEIVERAAKSADYHSKPNSGHSAYDVLSQKVDSVISDLEVSKEDRKNLWASVRKNPDS